MSRLNITEEVVMLLYSDADRKMNNWDQILKYNKEIPVTQQYKSQFNKVLTTPKTKTPTLYVTPLSGIPEHCNLLHCKSPYCTALLYTALHCISVPYPKPGRAENTE